MELLVTKQGSFKLYRIVHGNKVKKAVGDDYLKKMPAGFDKEGNLYVYKKQPKSVKYKNIPIYETDYVNACPKCHTPFYKESK
ncbi:MAG: hypothetical protein WC554_02895 [Clostridia bacterium]|jgi:hypothetical protein